MCIGKAKAKRMLNDWGYWFMIRRAGGIGMGPSSDGCCGPERLAVGECSQVGHVPSQIVIDDMPDDVAFVERRLSKLDDKYKRYAELLYVLVPPKGKKSIIFALEIICKELGLSASQYKSFARSFWDKVTAVLG